MSDVDNVKESFEDVNIKFDNDMKMQKIREEVLKKFNDYRQTINYMAADAPIGVLCLSPAIQSALVAHGCLRIYDLFDLDFVKVKGLGVRRIGELTASLDKFFSML